MKDNITKILIQALKNNKTQGEIEYAYALLQEYLNLIKLIKLLVKINTDTKLDSINLIERFREIIKEKYEETNFLLFSPPEKTLLLTNVNEITTELCNHIKLFKEKKRKEGVVKEDASQLDEHFIKTGKIIEYIHKKEYIKIFNKLDVKKDHLQLAKHFDNIAELFIELGKFTQEPKYYYYSAISCQYVRNIIDNPLNEKEKCQGNIESLKKKCFERYSEIQKLILESAGIDVEKLEPITKDNIDEFSGKEHLKALREKVEKYLKEHKNNFFDVNDKDLNKNKEFFAKITKEMQEYLKNLFVEAETKFGKPPCEYAVIGLGSMAHGQITPYSDLEFAIITKDDKYTQNTAPEIRNYFKNLSSYVSFKIACLGESAIPNSYYNHSINMDYFVKPGVMLDFGGKTPLGSLYGDKQYELIGTEKHFMGYICKGSSIDKNLPYILERVCFVHRGQSLFNEYKREVETYLTNPDINNPNMTNACTRAREHFLNCLEFSEKGERKAISNKDQFTLDTFDYSPFNIKNIYRLVTFCIKNLSSIFYKKDMTNHEIIDSLKERGIITNDAAKNLKEALDFVIMLRIIVYNYYKCQDELIVWEAQEKDQVLVFTDKNGKLIIKVPLKAFYQYYTISLSLEKKLVEFYKKSKNNSKIPNKDEFFKDTEFYDNNIITEALVDIKLLKVDKAMQNLLLELLKWKNPKKLENQHEEKKALSSVADILDTIKSICEYPDKYKDQHENILKHYKTASNTLKKWVEKSDFLTIISNICCTYKNENEPDYFRLLDFYKKILDMYKSLYKTDLNIVKATENYKETPDHYEKELIFYGKILDIYIEIYLAGNRPTTEVINWFSLTYQKLNNTLPQQESLQNTYLEIMGAVYYKLGSFYKNLGYYSAAILYYTLAEENGYDDHTILANIGTIYHTLGNNEPHFAILYYTLAAISYKKAVDKGCNDPIVLANMDINLRNLNLNQQAIECYNISKLDYFVIQLKLFEKIFSVTNDSDYNIQLTILQQFSKLLEAAQINLGITYDDPSFEEKPDVKRFAADSNYFMDPSGMDASMSS